MASDSASTQVLPTFHVCSQSCPPSGEWKAELKLPCQLRLRRHRIQHLRQGRPRRRLSEAIPTRPVQALTPCNRRTSPQASCWSPHRVPAADSSFTTCASNALNRRTSAVLLLARMTFSRPRQPCDESSKYSQSGNLELSCETLPTSLSIVPSLSQLCQQQSQQP